MPALPLHGREVSQVLDFAHGGQAAQRDTGHSPDISWAAAPHTEPSVKPCFHPCLPATFSLASNNS